MAALVGGSLRISTVEADAATTRTVVIARTHPSPTDVWYLHVLFPEDRTDKFLKVAIPLTAGTPIQSAIESHCPRTVTGSLVTLPLASLTSTIESVENV
jgi:hypothetical protein